MSWEHTTEYPLPSFKDFSNSGSGAGFQKSYELAKEHSFLCDHIVDGRILMPVRGDPCGFSLQNPAPLSLAFCRKLTIRRLSANPWMADVCLPLAEEAALKGNVMSPEY